LISLFLKYVWRIVSPGVNVSSSVCGIARSSSSSTVTLNTAAE
jgi:hypothetical protein